MKFQNLVKSIEQAQILAKKNALTAVNTALTIRNWRIGSYIWNYEQEGMDRAKYGQKLIRHLSDKLTEHRLKGMSGTALKTFRQFYLAYPSIGQAVPDQLEHVIKQIPRISGRLLSDETKFMAGKDSGESINLAPLISKLTFTHFVELIKVEGKSKRMFYEAQAIENNWGSRQLKRQIGSLLFERIGLSKNKSTLLKKSNSKGGDFKIEDAIKDPYILEFTGLAEQSEYSENDLETALINHIQEFLLELGTGFCFEGRQYRITVGGEHDRIDLVFYHRVLRCHVLIDLKIREFTHADAGQMNYYLNYFKDNIMKAGDNPPVGLVLCAYKDKTKVAYATSGMDNKLFVSKYKVYLPSEKELLKELEKEKDDFMLKESRVKYGK
jgi:predicted nuclease of restriction endonuclease-like (RecB) superfamily